MRTLSATLLAAQKAEVAVPYCKVELRQNSGGFVRLDWQRLFTGSDADYYHALAMAPDGSLVRARVDSNADPTLRYVWVQRVAAPGEGSDYSNWSRIDVTDHANDVKLAAHPSYGSEVLAVCLGHDGANNPRVLRWARSVNNGATWSGWSAILTAAADIGHIALSLRSNGDACLLYSEGAVVKSLFRISDVWGSPNAWTNTLAAITGLALTHYGDSHILVSGTDSYARSGVWSCTHAYPALTWTALLELQAAESDSGLEYHCPFMADVPVLSPAGYRAWYSERRTAAPTYQRPCFTLHPTGYWGENMWREPAPFNVTASYGVAIGSAGDYAWSSTVQGVWRAALSPAPTDLTPRVVSMRQSVHPPAHPGDCVVSLDGSDGTVGPSVAAAWPGLELLVSPGFVTTAGSESSAGPSFWVESVEHLSGGPSTEGRRAGALPGKGQSLVVVHAVDAWGLLERWRARRQYQWAAADRSLYQLLRWLLARAAGLVLSADSHSDHVWNHKPAFTIHPGNSGLAVLNRILAMVQDQVYVRENAVRLKNVLSGDSSDYSYDSSGPPAHGILGGRYLQAAWGVNRVQVFGAGVQAESLQWPQIEDAGDRLHQAIDATLATSTRVDERAAAILREAELSSQSGEITVPMSCGQELWDVVTITDARIPLTASKRRVSGLTLSYDARKPEYTLKIGLGAV